MGIFSRYMYYAPDYGLYRIIYDAGWVGYQREEVLLSSNSEILSIADSKKKDALDIRTSIKTRKEAIETYEIREEYNLSIGGSPGQNGEEHIITSSDGVNFALPQILFTVKIQVVNDQSKLNPLLLKFIHLFKKSIPYVKNGEKKGPTDEINSTPPELEKHISDLVQIAIKSLSFVDFWINGKENLENAIKNGLTTASTDHSPDSGEGNSVDAKTFFTIEVTSPINLNQFQILKSQKTILVSTRFDKLAFDNNLVIEDLTTSFRLELLPFDKKNGDEYTRMIKELLHAADAPSGSAPIQEGNIVRLIKERLGLDLIIRALPYSEVSNLKTVKGKIKNHVIRTICKPKPEDNPEDSSEDKPASENSPASFPFRFINDSVSFEFDRSQLIEGGQDFPIRIEKKGFRIGSGAEFKSCTISFIISSSLKNTRDSDGNTVDAYLKSNKQGESVASWFENTFGDLILEKLSRYPVKTLLGNDQSGDSEAQKNDQGSDSKIQDSDQGSDSEAQKNDQGSDSKIQDSDQGNDSEAQKNDQGSDSKIQDSDQGSDSEAQKNDQGSDSKIQDSDQGSDSEAQKNDQGSDNAAQNNSENKSGLSRITSFINTLLKKYPFQITEGSFSVSVIEPDSIEKYTAESENIPFREAPIVEYILREKVKQSKSRAEIALEEKKNRIKSTISKLLVEEEAKSELQHKLYDKKEPSSTWNSLVNDKDYAAIEADILDKELNSQKKKHDHLVALAGLQNTLENEEKLNRIISELQEETVRHQLSKLKFDQEKMWDFWLRRAEEKEHESLAVKTSLIKAVVLTELMKKDEEKRNQVLSMIVEHMSHQGVDHAGFVKIITESQYGDGALLSSSVNNMIKSILGDFSFSEYLREEFGPGWTEKTPPMNDNAQ